MSRIAECTIVIDVTQWLHQLGLGRYAAVFAENDVDQEALRELSETDLEKLGVTLGHRKKILKALATLRDDLELEARTGELNPPESPSPSARSTEAERRQLTVMFCDLVGSTELSQHLDPEDLREVMAAYQDACKGAVDRFGGYVARYMGDGVLAYFGYPRAHEQDPERAVRSGLEVVAAMDELTGRIGRAKGIEFAVRVGIATGPVIVGDLIGEGASQESAVLGETPNLAARLQGLAAPNTLVIAEDTFRLSEGLFECEDLGQHCLKGIRAPATAYRVRGPSDAPSRFEAAVARGLTPMVGREEEINLFLKRWDHAKGGEGQVALLSAEPGVGKSRILRALQDRLEGELRNRILYFCSPYHQHSALYPAINQFQRALRFKRGESAVARLSRLEVRVAELGLPTEEFVPVLANTLSLPAPEKYPDVATGPEELRRKIFDATVAVIEAMAASEPVLMIVEDVQWIDATTLELLGRIIERIENERILLVITYRPEFVPPWTGHPQLTAVTLNRLSRKESAAIVSKVAAGKDLGEAVIRQIVDKTDGVPLFIEELTKAVLESGLLQDDSGPLAITTALPAPAIPESLQDSLMARLDRLGPAKEIIQLGATIGRTFSHGLLAAVSSLSSAELEKALSPSLDAGLIYRRGRRPWFEYEFKHALVRDEAYASMLKTTRRQHHERIARTLQTRFPETVDAEPEILAHHFTEGGLSDEAVPYWHRAGQHATDRSANPEAISHLTRGLELLETLPDNPERAKTELSFLISLGVPYRQIKGVGSQEVDRTYTRARELSERIGSVNELFPVLWGLWAFHRARNEFAKAQELVDQLFTLAVKERDTTLLLEAHHARWTTCLFVGDWNGVLEHVEKGIALYDREEHHSLASVYGGHDAGECGLSQRAMSLWLLGYADQATQAAQTAEEFARDLPNPICYGHALDFATMFHYVRQDEDAVLERAKEVIRYGNEFRIARYVATANLLKAWAFAKQNPQAAPVADARAALDLLRTTGFVFPAPYYLAVAAEVYTEGGEPSVGLELIGEALEVTERTGMGFWESELHRTKGEYLAAQSKDPAKTEACFVRAIEVARNQKARMLELRAATSLARWLDAENRPDDARKHLYPVYNWFTEGFDAPDLQKARVLLAALTD